MTKLSDTQAIVLAAAAQRSDGNVLPLPGSLRGGAADKVVGALLSRGLIREEPGDSPTKADPAMNTIWRNDEEGHSVLLRITPVGLDAINVDREPTGAEGPALAAAAYRFNAGPNSAGESAARESTATDTALAKASAKKPATTGADAATTRKTRDGSKQARLIAMLRRKEGATIAQIVEATGWQPHTVRGAFAGALKKRLGLSVTSEKVEGVRVYRINA